MSEARAAILLTGGSGQVGREVLALDWPADLRLVAPGRAELDLADAASIARYLSDKSFAGILSCGAYTAVDKAEDDRDTAFAANAAAPGLLAAAAAATHAPIVHVSTDYVFDGSKTGAYVEEDMIAPLGVYGASKAQGEAQVRGANPRHAIIRTAWVMSRHERNFLHTMLRLGSERETLRVVDDQHGTPTFAADLAQALRTVMLRLLEPGDADPNRLLAGTWHFANTGQTTWCGVAREIFRQSAALGGPAPKVEAITTADYPTRAPRPANSALDTGRFTHDFGIVPRPWREALADPLAALIEAKRRQTGDLT